MSQRIAVAFGTEDVFVELDDAVQVLRIGGGEHEQSARPLTARADETVSERVAAALTRPVTGLGIDQFLMPGDRLGIALEPGLPRPDEILRGVLRAMEVREPGEIRVVVSEWTDSGSLEQIRRALPETAELVIHRIADRDGLSYVGADEEAEPIRLCSALVDSDVVVPIGVLRSADPLTGGALSDAVCPGLGDAGLWKRLMRRTTRAVENLQPSGTGELGSQAWAESQVEQVHWALGLQFLAAVEVIEGGEIGQVIAGTPETVRDAARSLPGRSEASGDSEPAEVTVVCVEGGPEQQTLANLARAAWIGRCHAAPAGSIVLISDIASFSLSAEPRVHADATPRDGEPNGVSTEDDGDTTNDRTDTTQADFSADEPVAQAAFARRLLADLVNRTDPERRYLLWSRCPADLVESFGFGVIESPASLAKLINQHPRCRVIRVAQATVSADTAGVRSAGAIEAD